MTRKEIEQHLKIQHDLLKHEPSLEVKQHHKNMIKYFENRIIELTKNSTNKP